MFSAQLPPSCVTCNAAISACEFALQWQLAVHGLRAIHALRLSPDVISWNSAASACEKRSAWSQAPSPTCCPNRALMSARRYDPARS